MERSGLGPDKTLSNKQGLARAMLLCNTKKLLLAETVKCVESNAALRAALYVKPDVFLEEQEAPGPGMNSRELGEIDPAEMNELERNAHPFFFLWCGAMRACAVECLAPLLVALCPLLCLAERAGMR